MTSLTSTLSGTTAVVTGASRGFGRAVATALGQAGAQVIGVARHAPIGELPFVVVVGDATDPNLAAELLDRHRPRTVVLAAGAAPLSAPLQEHTWESFSRCWDVDVQQAFHWTRAALVRPLAPGSTVICFSSGAAVQGSPLSGGYAGAKRTITFITRYAGEESARAALGVRFTSVLPKLTPDTALGAAAVASYAARAGLDVPAFLAQFGPTPTPEQTAQDVLALAVDPSYDLSAYLLVPTGGLVPM